MATPRKTAKYYREEIVKSHNATTMEELLKEVVKKFGNGKSLYLGGRVDFNWNHRVDGFSLDSKGKLYVNVYWQGDSTDGDDSVSFREVYYNGKSVIRAVHHWLGDRTYEVHSDIRVERYEVEELIKELAKWLSASEIKERKLRSLLSTINKEIESKLGNDYYRKYASSWGRNEEYYNGCRAVREWTNKMDKELLKMEREGIFKAVDKIFHNNKRSDSYFGTNWNGDRSKPYDLTY